MDIYAEITARIIDQMENGIIPWQKPWVANGNAISHATGKAYSLLNQMLLGRPGEYLTFKQCQEAGGRIRKGEKASMVVFWKWIEQEDEETGEKKEIPFLRYYNVFHIDQCEGLKAKHMPELPATAKPDETAENMIAAYAKWSGVRIAIRRATERSISLPPTASRFLSWLSSQRLPSITAQPSMS